MAVLRRAAKERSTYCFSRSDGFANWLFDGGFHLGGDRVCLAGHGFLTEYRYLSTRHSFVARRGVGVVHDFCGVEFVGQKRRATFD
jgi:hypothetical protein